MRKLNKSVSLSTVYAAWLKSLEDRGRNHPAYSPKRKYYWDVVMNLFHCQNGLCAYTEMVLCSPQCFEPTNWQEGRYSFVTKPEVFGDVEHFDNRLKVSKGWLWDNLFMVDSNINTRAKGLKLPDSILKPDRDEYDEFSLLEYNTELHIFIPNTDRSDEECARIKETIKILGINHPTVITKRIKLLSEPLSAVRQGVKTWEEISIHEFPTAFEMSKRAFLDRNS